MCAEDLVALPQPIRRWLAHAGVVGGSDAKPTSQSYTVFNDLSAQLDRQLQAMRDALLVLPSINQTLKLAGLNAIVPSTEEIKTAPIGPPSPRASAQGSER